MDAKVVHDDTREIAGTQQQVGIVSLDGEALNRHDRRRVGRAAEPPKNKALANTAGMREVGGVEFLKGDGHRKIFLQRLSDAVLRKGPVPCEDHAADAEGQRENAKHEQRGLAEFREVCRTILDHGVGPLGFPLPFWADLTSSGQIRASKQRIFCCARRISWTRLWTSDLDCL
jgi:hypothetical protein